MLWTQSDLRFTLFWKLYKKSHFTIFRVKRAMFIYNENIFDFSRQNYFKLYGSIDGTFMLILKHCVLSHNNKNILEFPQFLIVHIYG